MPRASRSRQDMRARYETLLNVLGAPDVAEEGLSLSGLAARLGVGERTVRNYVSELSDLGLVEIRRSGGVGLTRKVRRGLRKEDDPVDDPLDRPFLNIFSPELGDKTVEEFLAVVEEQDQRVVPQWESRLLRLTRDDAEVERLREFLTKLDSPLLGWSEVREELRSLPPQEVLDPRGRIQFFGDRFVGGTVSPALPSDANLALGGVANRSKPKTWWIHGVAALFPVLLSTSAAEVRFNGVKAIGTPRFLTYPTQRTLREDDLPAVEVPELFTSYGDLSNVPLRVAARLLATAQLFRAGADLVESADQPLDFLFINGTLFPHGYFYPDGSAGRTDAAYLRLLREVTDSYAKLIRQVRDRGTHVVGYSTTLRDTKFATTVLRHLGLRDLRIPDSVLMSQLLEDRAMSCLFKRVESGKPSMISKQSFEFYLNIRDQIADVEFIQLWESDDVQALQREVAQVVYVISQPLTYTKPFQEYGVELVGTMARELGHRPNQVPFILQEAVASTDMHMNALERLLDQVSVDVEASIRGRIINLFDDVPIHQE